MKVPQYIYHNLNTDTFEVYISDSIGNKDLKLLGNLREMLTRLDNLEDTNRKLTKAYNEREEQFKFMATQMGVVKD